MLKILFLLFVSFIGIYLNVWFLLMTFGHKSKLKERKKAIKFPTISVLIPAYNEARNLPKALNSLINLDYPKNKLEVIVIDNGSTDDTLKVAKRFKLNRCKLKIRIFSLPVRGKVKALNLGLKYAKGEIIGVLDADTIVSKSCLKRMIGYFNEKVGAVTNHVKVVHSRGLLPSIQEIEYVFSAFSKKLISFLDALYIVPGTLSLIRRDIIDNIGFSEDTVTEDMDIALCMLKRNYKIVNALDAISYTEVPCSFRDLLKQRIRWYRGFIQNLKKHSDIVFNKRYAHLGYFIFPFSSILAIFVGGVLTILLIFNLIRNTLLFIKDITYIPIFEKLGMSFGKISLVSFIVEPYSTIAYVTILTGSFIVLFISFRALKIKFKKRLILLPLYFFLYYNLIILFWIISTFMELIGWKKKW